MVESALVAVVLLLLIDLSFWVYGRMSLSLDRKDPKIGGTYFSFLMRRFEIVLAFLGALFFVMMPTDKPLALRIALLVVIGVGYSVISFRALRAGLR